MFTLIGLGLLHAVKKYAAVGEDNRHKRVFHNINRQQFKNNINPEASRFFPYALFFMVMQLLALVMATVPPDVLALPLLYATSGLLILVILFRG